MVRSVGCHVCMSIVLMACVCLSVQALEYDILFVPSTRRHPSGKQVYTFGSVPVVMDQDLVYRYRPLFAHVSLLAS